jgi:hypothetical protein
MVYLAISGTTRALPFRKPIPKGALFSKFVEQLKPGAAVTIGPEDAGIPSPACATSLRGTTGSSRS